MRCITAHILRTLMFAAATGAHAQVAAVDSTHGIVGPYVGIGWSPISASGLNEHLNRFGAPSLTNGRLVQEISLGMVAGAPWAPFTVALEWNIGLSSNDVGEGYVRYRAITYSARFGYGGTLGDTWRWSVTAGLGVGYQSITASSGSDLFGSRAFDSLTAAPTAFTREISLEEYKLTPAITVGYPISVGTGDGRDRFILAAIRAGTTVRLGNAGWRINGEHALDGPEAPYRPVFVDLLLSMMLRSGG